MIGWLLLSVLPLVVLLVASFNALTWRRGRTTTHVKPRLSVLIPARNEEKTIRTALSSVLSADCAGLVEEILVYDDKSTDSTPDIVRQMSLEDGRIRLISGGPLPPGWIGKPHAASQLGEASRGDLLLFMDADVELKPRGLLRLLSLTDPPVRGRVITAMPEQISGSFFERLVLPLLPLTYLAWLPLRLVEVGNDPRTVAANGQLLLLSRMDYRELGGFEAVKNEIVDDVAFCRHAKRSKLRVVFADGTLIARCRMYEGFQETIFGFSKNLYEGVGGALGTLSVIGLYFTAFLLPYLGFSLSLLAPNLREDLLSPSLVGVGANVLLQILLVTRYKQPLSFIFFQPLSIVCFILIALNSWRWQRASRVAWSGRDYANRETRTLEQPAHRRSPPNTLERGTP